MFFIYFFIYFIYDSLSLVNNLLLSLSVVISTITIQFIYNNCISMCACILHMKHLLLIKIIIEIIESHMNNDIFMLIEM